MSKPDIILKNRSAFLNFAIREGNLTTSDHIPIMFAPSTKAIVVGNGVRSMYKQTNWEAFKTSTENDIRRKAAERDLSGNPRGIDKDIIDEQLVGWYNIIKTRLEENTPKKNLSYVPHPRESDLLKALQMAYNQIKTAAIITPDTRRQLLFLQQEIKTENLRLSKIMWDRLVNSIDISRRDPKKFWDKFRQLVGGKKSGIPSYILDEDGSKITEEDKKLERFKGVWEKIFTISEEDNREFDHANEIRILRFLADNNYRMQPYQTANRNRLDSNNPLTKPLTMNEMISIISN